MGPKTLFQLLRPLWFWFRASLEVLNLDLLCAETEEIREILTSWEGSRKRKATVIKEA